MGIDVYARWEGMTEEEKKAQYTGFSIVHGHVGYLREAYHGGPYATRELVKEAFEAEDCEAEIPASVMRARLPKVEELARRREIKIYKGDPNDERWREWDCVRSFGRFVELCEQKEKETGRPVKVMASY